MVALPTARMAIIGGSGLYELDALGDVSEIDLETPYGSPSDTIRIGKLGERSVAFLSRHGRGHTLTPAEIPAAANIYALKQLGVREIVSVSAVGSLRDDYAPAELVIPDQIIDRTGGARRSTFFGDGIVVHVSLAEPYCAHLRARLADAARTTGKDAHGSGTYICIGGPRFSTRAESELYRSWGAHVIGMTAVPEAALAREAEICYATLALVTDYDCWRGGEADVDARTVADTMARNVATAQLVVAALIASAGADGDPDRDCDCRHALANAVITDPAAVSAAPRRRLGILLAE